MEKYQAGNRVTGVINNITDLGIFVTLPNRHSGLVHHSDFGNNWLRERRRYHVGDEVQDEWAEGDVGHIFVLAVIKAPAPGTHIDRRTPAIGTLPIYRRGHAAATASAPEKTGKDVRVLPLIGQTVGV